MSKTGCNLMICIGCGHIITNGVFPGEIALMLDIIDIHLRIRYYRYGFVMIDDVCFYCETISSD